MQKHTASLIHSARVAQSLSVEELAQKIGVQAQEIETLEAGELVALNEWTVARLRHFAEILQVNISQLVGDPVLHYDEWALVLSALVQYSAQRPGLAMETDMVDLIKKVRSFTPNQKTAEHG